MPTENHSPTADRADRNTYASSVEITSPGRMLFISGQVPTRSDGSTPPGFDEQCRNAWGRVLDLLTEQGMTVRDLVKVTTFLRDRSDKEENSRIRQDVLGDHLPALTVIVTRLFEADWLVEIEAVAAA